MKVCFGDLPGGSVFYSGGISVDTRFMKLKSIVASRNYQWNAVNCRGGVFVWFEPYEDTVPIEEVYSDLRFSANTAEMNVHPVNS